MTELTAKDLLDRCEEDGDCLIWKGIASKSGVPKVNIHCTHTANGRTVVSARRVVWELTHGPVPARKYVTTNCGHPGCLKHLVLTTKAEIAREIGRRPDVKARKSVACGGERSPHSVLTRAQVEEIRASRESSRELAEKGIYPVGQSAIARIKSGGAWKDFGNPWSGLFASNDSSKKAA